MIDFSLNNYVEIFSKLGDHMSIALTAVLLGCIVSIPLGAVLSQNRKLASFALSVTSILQTIPSLALLAMMVPVFGIGRTPAIVALFIYSLMPILRNTVLGMNGVDPAILDAAKGMGMTSIQRIMYVKFPLAFSVIMTGVRLSTVYVIAWTTLASYIGAGGMGDFIFNGLNNYNIPMIIWGTIPVSITALLVNYLLNKLEHSRFIVKGGSTS